MANLEVEPQNPAGERGVGVGVLALGVKSDELRDAGGRGVGDRIGDSWRSDAVCGGEVGGGN